MVGPVAAGHELGALLDAQPEQRFDAAPLHVGDDGADDGVGLQRVPHLHPAGRLLEAAHDLVVDGLLGDDPGRRGADLAGVEGPHRGDGADRGLEVGVVEDDGGALATELKHWRFIDRPQTSPMRWPTDVDPVKDTMSTWGEDGSPPRGRAHCR